MNSINKIKYMSIFIFLFAFGLVGCSGNKKGSFDYEQYVKKIWIVENVAENQVNERFSFVITSIESNHVEGQYLVDSKRINPSRGLPGSFTGSIEGKNIQARLKYDDENAGNMILELQDDGRIVAAIEYSYSDEVINDKSVFRPYLIEDVDNLLLDEKNTLSVKMDLWGNVKIARGVININKSYPAAFMMNENNEILYEFDAPYKTGTTIRKVFIKDYNGDGLKDVNIVTYFKDNEIEPFQWIYYQDTMGTFHLESVVQSTIL